MDDRPLPARLRPLAGPVAVVVLAGLLALPQPRPWTFLLLAVVACAVGLSDDGARRGAAAFLLATATVMLLTLAQGNDPAVAAREMLFASVRGGVPWLVGYAWRLRTQVRRQAVERLAQERHARRDSARRRRDAERLALAESLHDHLGHDLSLVALQLGRLELDPDLTGPARDRVAAARRQLARAVDGLGTSVDSLRSGAAPGLARSDDVAALLTEARRAGAAVSVTGLSHELPRTADRASLVRVLREGLTNAVRHAPGQPVTVAVAGEGPLVVTVRNPLAPHPPTGGTSGTGLASLTGHLERAGGTLHAGDDGETFTLRATVATRRPAGAFTDDPPPDDGADDDDHEDDDGPEREAALLSGARRRGRAVLLAATVVIVAALGAVEAFTLVEAHRALLPEQDFARIEFGDARDEVAHLLPEHELLPRPAAEAGTACHDYAITTARFDDASGDVHRVCFTDGVVAFAGRLAPADR
ncbi:histidine kinase [Isoptericola sp. S6320L]|uniref:sensor histidine kinase n=1 Tax=Isoptericola sp. S6320L TaxID=2926411 RepID=UPI001FF29C4A|nr:histidine kinase [Isoptericola sp. S6320L]MCK0118373.1 histidine kinase [Isoptericola sp. S6320L]